MSAHGQDGLARWLAAAFSALAIVTESSAQLGTRMDSRIGTQAIDTWTAMGEKPMAMTPDGSLVVWTERHKFGNGCGLTMQRLSMIRGDGTGFRVLLDDAQLEALSPAPPGFSTRIISLAVSGDGATVAFGWPTVLDSSCNKSSPIRMHLLDIVSGEIHELEPDATIGVGNVSFSDDGERIAYWVWRQTEVEHVTALRSGPAEYAKDIVTTLTTGELGANFRGMLTGDGRSLVFAASESVLLDAPTEVYRLDLESGRLVKLSPAPLPAPVNVSASSDGKRVVYSRLVDSTGVSIYGVDGDGTDLHVVHEGSLFGSAVITRDGEWVFFKAKDPLPSTTHGVYRVAFGGGVAERLAYAIPEPIFTSGEIKIPVNGTGSRLAHRAFTSGDDPLTVAYFGDPVLTSYGTPAAGETMHVDVGGAAGSPWLLLASLHDSVLRTPWGVLYLHPDRLLPIAAGTTQAPWNIATESFVIPPAATLSGAIVHLQAMVWDGGPYGGHLTNRTTLAFP